jgi:hypothetical protein
MQFMLPSGLRAESMDSGHARCIKNMVMYGAELPRCRSEFTFCLAGDSDFLLFLGRYSASERPMPPKPPAFRRQWKSSDLVTIVLMIFTQSLE